MITAAPLIKLGFIESWGRGFRKIQQGLHNAKLKFPIFEAKMGDVLVTIFRGKTAPETAQKTTPYENPHENPHESLSRLDLQIIEVIRSHQAHRSR